MRIEARVCSVLLALGLAGVGLWPVAGRAAAARPMREVVALDKLNPTLRHHWEQERSWVARQRYAECFVKLRAPVTAEDREALQHAGFHPRSEMPVFATQTAARAPSHHAEPTHVILTGHIRVRDLPALSVVPSVESIEGDVKVQRKVRVDKRQVR